MIKSSSRRAAVVLSGSAIALTAAMLPAQAATSSWRVNSELRTRGNINVVFGVDAVSARDAWATGVTANNKTGRFKSVLRHWTGRGWHPVTLPAGANLASIQAARGGTIWIGGSIKNGRGTTAFAAHWAAPASAWTLADLGSASSATWELTDIAPDGGGGLWGVAVAGNVKGQPAQLWHLTGATWSQVAPAFGKHQWTLVQLTAVPGTASVWAAGVLKSGNTGNGFIAIDGPTPR